MANVPATGDRNAFACLKRVMDFAWFGRDVSGTAKPPIALNNETLDAVNFAGTAQVGMVKLNASNVTEFPNTSGNIFDGPVTFLAGNNYIATETGANNAIAGALPGVVLAAGLMVKVKLAHTLQAGANTFNLNAGGAVGIKSHFNIANNIATAYAATGLIELIYDGSEWLDTAQ